jgi:hypothetical protein
MQAVRVSKLGVSEITAMFVEILLVWRSAYGDLQG